MSEHTDGRFDVEGVVPDQCLGSVPTLTCVAGNRGVRSSGGQAQVAPAPSGGRRRRGRLDGRTMSEPLVDASSGTAPDDGWRCRGAGTEPLRGGERRLWDATSSRRTPRFPGYRGRPPQSYLMRVQRGNPVGVRMPITASGRLTVREAQLPGGNRRTQEANAGGRKAAGTRDMNGRLLPPIVPYNRPDTGCARTRKGADVGLVGLWRTNGF